MERAARLAFVLGLVVLGFGYGFVARSWKLPPYEQLKPVGDAVEAVRLYFTDADYLTFPAPPGKGGVTLVDEAAAAPGVTFIARYDGERFGAELVDLQGRVLHRWTKLFSEVWGDSAPHVKFVSEDRYLEWHGVHLYPDGSVLFNFEGLMFPFGGGLIKIDRDSNLVWKLAHNTHHSIALAEDGTIWVPSVHYRPDGMAELPGFEPWFYEDTILKVSPDGEVLDEISVPLALRSLPGVLPAKTEGFDITHLNDVEPVSAAAARAFPMFREGDVLVSLRNLSALVAIDPITKTARWAMTGPFRRQHDPDLLPNGRLMVFDNLGGDKACGRTRILEIEPVTQEVTWSYDGCQGGQRFESEAWGEQQLLPNGNVLITESMAGRAFEVTRDANPRIVWSYENRIGEGGHSDRGAVIGLAQRLAPEDLPFLNGSAVAEDHGPPAPAALPPT
jgi:hypothetical protein